MTNPLIQDLGMLDTEYAALVAQERDDFPVIGDDPDVFSALRTITECDHER